MKDLKGSVAFWVVIIVVMIAAGTAYWTQNATKPSTSTTTITSIPQKSVAAPTQQNSSPSRSAVSNVPYSTIEKAYETFNAPSSPSWKNQTISLNTKNYSGLNFFNMKMPSATLSVRIPSFFAVQGDSQSGGVSILQNGADDSLTLPFIMIQFGDKPFSLQDDVNFAKEVLSAGGLSFTESSTTFEGHAVHTISILNQGWSRYFLFVEVNGIVLEIQAFYLTDQQLSANGIHGQDLILVHTDNEVVMQILNSIHILNAGKE